MKASIACLFVIVGLVCAENQWWDPLGMTTANQNKPVFAQMSPALQKSVPANVQRQLARITPKDLLGLRSLAERMTQHPTSRADFIKELNQKAPNVLFLGTEMYKVAHDAYTNTRKGMSTDSIKFLRSVADETNHMVNEASALFNKQDIATKKNLVSVFPFIPQLIQSSKNSIQYVSKNI